MISDKFNQSINQMFVCAPMSSRGTLNMLLDRHTDHRFVFHLFSTAKQLIRSMSLASVENQSINDNLYSQEQGHIINILKLLNCASIDTSS